MTGFEFLGREADPSQGRTRGSGLRFHQERFKLGVRKNSSMERVGKPWHSWPGLAGQPLVLGQLLLTWGHLLSHYLN